MARFKVDAPSSRPKPVYRMANYDGGNPAHPEPEPSGTLRFTADGHWELRFAGRRGNDLRGSLRRMPLAVAATGPSSCSVRVQRAVDRGVTLLSFDLPDTPASVLLRDLATRPNGTWSAADEAAHRLEQVDAEHAVSFSVLFLGGLSTGSLKSDPRHVLWFTSAGVATESPFHPRTSLCAWQEVRHIEVVAGQMTATRKIAATLMWGVLGGLLADGPKDRTYLSLELTGGTVGVWEVDRKRPIEVTAALAPLLRALGVPQLLEGSSTGPSDGATGHGMVPLVADELAKLGALRERGLLTDEELAAQKAKLLNAM